MGSVPNSASRSGRFRNNNKRRKLGFYGGKSFVLLADDMRKSLAYQSLKPTARIIAIDMIGVYRKASMGDEIPLPEGFLYTPKHCGEIVSYNTFYKAVKEVVAHGIFDIPPDLQGNTVAQCRRFAPSNRWQTWTDQAASKKVLAQKKALQSKCTRDSKRRAKYHSREPGEISQAA